MLSTIPISANCITSAVPPKLKKGKEIPVLGIRLVTTPMFKNTCTASRVMMPTVVRVPNLSRAWRASQYPRRMSMANRMSTMAPPI